MGDIAQAASCHVLITIEMSFLTKFERKKKLSWRELCHQIPLKNPLFDISKHLITLHVAMSLIKIPEKISLWLETIPIKVHKNAKCFNLKVSIIVVKDYCSFYNE